MIITKYSKEMPLYYNAPAYIPLRSPGLVNDWFLETE